MNDSGFVHTGVCFVYGLYFARRVYELTDLLTYDRVFHLVLDCFDVLLKCPNFLVKRACEHPAALSSKPDIEEKSGALTAGAGSSHRRA